MNASLQETKIDLIQWLTVLDDTETLQKIIDLRTQSSEVVIITSPAEKASIHKGLADADAGNTHMHSVAKQVYEKWL